MAANYVSGFKLHTAVFRRLDRKNELTGEDVGSYGYFLT